MAYLVFADGTGDSLPSSALELLTKARSLGGDVAAFYTGPASDENVAALGAHGAATVHHLATESALPSAEAAAALAGARLVASTQCSSGWAYLDRDVAGRLSARLGSPVLANAVDVSVDGGSVVVTNEILGGTQRVLTTAASTPAVVIARPKAFPAEPGGDASPEVVAVDSPDVGHAGSATVIERHVEQSEGPDLEEAEVIISGGRGLGDVGEVHDDGGARRTAQGSGRGHPCSRRLPDGCRTRCRSDRPARR